MPLFTATFLTLLVYLFDSMNKSKRQLWFYFVLFCLSAGISYFILGLNKVEATEIRDEKFLSVLHADIFNGQHPLDDDDEKPKHKKRSVEKMLQKQIEYHLKQGEAAYKEAKNRCALIPQKENFEKAIWCFQSILATATIGSPASRLISGIIMLGGQYCVAVMQEWQMIENALIRAECHFGLMEFYQDILKIEHEKAKSSVKITE